MFNELNNTQVFKTKERVSCCPATVLGGVPWRQTLKLSLDFIHRSPGLCCVPLNNAWLTASWFMIIRHHPLTPALNDVQRSHLSCSGVRPLLQLCDLSSIPRPQGVSVREEADSGWLLFTVVTLFMFVELKLEHRGVLAEVHDFLQEGALPLLGTVAWILKRLIKREWGDCLRWAHSLLLPRGPCSIGEPRNWSYFTIIDVFYCSKQ